MESYGQMKGQGSPISMVQRRMVKTFLPDLTSFYQEKAESRELSKQKRTLAKLAELLENIRS
jgi:hypothetical protein